MIVDVVAVVTVTVVTVKVAVVAPAATVTFAGTAAAPLLLDSVTIAPPAGAALVSVTVPVAEAGPTTLVGFTATDERLAAGGAGCGVIVRLAVRVTPSVPEITAVVFAVTALVLTANVALVAPAATVTLAGTVAAGWLLDRVIVAPPAGAAPLNVTVPVEAFPPTTLVGLSESVESVTGAGAPAGVIVSVAVPTTPP